ncbi:hypothetical protein L3V82_08170 [Thiotrichales bacterium 19S3-7]|nr:hypothetical protein [Thiotrichales bacterium 19S3-7]MCF6802230.1 hypothetical protein [Thiotrichales bacterium 19S3-11]
MHNYRPPLSELYTIIYHKEINDFLMPKLKSLGANFMGMAERSPYGNLFVSTDIKMAQLMYEASWYDDDIALKRNTNHLKILTPESFHQDNISSKILEHKRLKTHQVGNFTLPIKIGDTEIFTTISADSINKLIEIKNDKLLLLRDLILEFRKFMHLLTNECSFTTSKHIREKRKYYVSLTDKIVLSAYDYMQLPEKEKLKFLDAFTTSNSKQSKFYYCSNEKINDVRLVHTPFENFDLVQQGYQSSYLHLIFDTENNYTFL